jgi:hypothetical protein
MAKASVYLINGIRKAAKSIRIGQAYQWGHMGSCNCGHLAQAITRKTKAEIHARALRTRSGDWSEQLNDYCPTSGLPMDEVIDEMLAAGLTRTDLAHLERLSDPAILKAIDPVQLPLKHNRRDDAVLYLETWADLLEVDLSVKQSIDLVLSANKLERNTISEKVFAELELT